MVFIDITWGTFCHVNNIMHAFKIIQVEQKYRERKTLLNGLFIADQHSANSLKVVHHPDKDAFLALHAVANSNFATGFKMLAELTHMLERCSGFPRLFVSAIVAGFNHKQTKKWGYARWMGGGGDACAVVDPSPWLKRYWITDAFFNQ